ncbi:MAG TPA: carboxymuconolactone decarboxylase family protein [Caulobacteraceae bacterium]|nr:carboxymuconolactone decarboxylase family protein [Caulobacteraceae bacterium]
MARIPYFDTSKASGRAARAYEKLPPLNIFRMLGHSGELVDGFTRLGTQILYFTSLDPVLREIAILRVGVLSHAKYEVFQHQRIARGIGMSDALIAAIREGPKAALFDDAQREVMAFTDDVVANVRASEATFAPLRKRLGYKGLQELVITIGYYMLVSRFLETFDVDIEEGAAGAPPERSA